MNQHPRLFAAVGPFGSGKTTLTVNSIRSLVSSGLCKKERIAYILNDEGMQVDGSIAREAEVRPMVNGCFTCADEADLRRVIAELTETGMEWIFIEGFGITAGSEIKTFLDSLPHDSNIFCVIDARHFEQNLVSYGDLVANQIRSATCGIGITKYPESVTDVSDPLLEHVVDYVAEHNHGQRVYLVAPGDPVPLQVLSHVRLHEHSHECDCDNHASHHDHHHHHEHGHHDHAHEVHGIVPYYFQLRTDKENLYGEIVEMFRGKEYLVTRAKGAFGGTLFNMVQGTWEHTEDDPRSFLTFYARRPLELTRDMPALHELIVPLDESRYLGESYQLIRRESGSREETVVQIKRLLSEMPSRPVVIPAGDYVRLVTHPEHPLQEMKELSRRPSVVEEWFPKVLAVCMRYWIDSVETLRVLEEKVVPAEISTNKRELAVSIAWWLDRFPEELSAFRSEAELLNVSELCAEGTLSLTALNSNQERRYWQQRELIKALTFRNAHKDHALECRAIEHLRVLGAEPQLCISALEEVSL